MGTPELLSGAVTFGLVMFILIPVLVGGLLYWINR